MADANESKAKKAASLAEQAELIHKLCVSACVYSVIRFYKRVAAACRNDAGQTA